MAVSPTGIISTAPDKLRDLIAGTSAFQTWTGTATQAAAKLRTHFSAAKYDGLTLPFALVYWGDWVAQRGGYSMGTLMLYFHSEVSTEYQRGGSEAEDYSSPMYDHANNVGAVLNEMADDAEAAGALKLDHERMFTQVQQPARVPPERVEQGEVDYVDSLYQVNWGLRL